MKPEEIYNFVLKDKEFSKQDISEKFKLNPDEYYDLVRMLEEEEMIIEVSEDLYLSKETARIFQKRNEEKIIKEIKRILVDKENLQAVEKTSMIDWDDVAEIEKFVVFDGSERIYEIHKDKKVIRLEGKEIMDYNIFRLRFFEKFGVLLPTYKGIGQDWAKLVNKWYKEYGEISKNKTEDISDTEEAKDMILDYISNATPSDNHILKEGIVCIKEECIFVATKIIKRILKRNNFNVSLRKLAYVLDEYLISGSIPIKIENKSERFWKFYKDKFEMTSEKLELTNEKDEGEDE